MTIFVLYTCPSRHFTASTDELCTRSHFEQMKYNIVLYNMEKLDIHCAIWNKGTWQFVYRKHVNDLVKFWFD